MEEAVSRSFGTGGVTNVKEYAEFRRVGVANGGECARAEPAAAGGSVGGRISAPAAANKIPPPERCGTPKPSAPRGTNPDQHSKISVLEIAARTFQIADTHHAVNSGILDYARRVATRDRSGPRWAIHTCNPNGGEYSCCCARNHLRLCYTLRTPSTWHTFCGRTRMRPSRKRRE